jgi:predicted PurR-regulated permease PerM
LISSNTFLNILFVIITYFMYVTYQPFLMDMVVAILLAISLSKVYSLLDQKINNKYISATIMTLALALLLFGPLFYFITEAAGLIHKVTPDTIHLIVEKANELFKYLPDIVAKKVEEYFSANNLNLIYKNLASFVAPLTAKSAIFLKDMILIVIFYFFTLLYGKEILHFLESVSPLEKRKSEILIRDTQEVMGLVFYSAMFTAIFEGLLFGGFIQIYGFDGLFFTVMYAFASLIPVIGGAIMWLPISLYLYSTGDTKGAIIVALYSVIVISIIADTFIKPLIIDMIKKRMHNKIELNSMLIFFSIVAGLSTFGFWGVIIGPAITSIFISILKFYKKI